MEKSKKYIRIVSTVDYNTDYVYTMLYQFGLTQWDGDFGQPDAILAIGGDAAVLKASKFGLPILAWNQGHLGFLTTGKNLEQILEAYVKGTLTKESRRKLVVNADFKEYTALNEIAIVGEETGRLVETDLYINDKKITTYKGDGLIVSTPTGSTAWNLSAGGSLVEYGVSCMLLTPMNPFTMNVRPLIIDSSHEVILEKVEKLVIDGHDIIKPQRGTIIIRYASESVELYRMGEENFFEAIIEKLGWNQNIKN